MELGIKKSLFLFCLQAESEHETPLISHPTIVYRFTQLGVNDFH